MAARVHVLTQRVSWSRLTRPCATISLAALVVIVAAGCGAGPDRAAVEQLRERMRPTYDEESGRLTQLSYDADGDGVEEAIAFMDGTRLVRVEVDEDKDGRVDRREFFRPAVSEDVRGAGSAGPSGPNVTLERIERQPGPDGTMTRVERFEGGVLSSIEQDSDQDGRIDTWETYVDGALSVLALDTTGRGSPDRRLLYSSSGEVRVEVDPDGAGEFRALDSEP